MVSSSIDISDSDDFYKFKVYYKDESFKELINPLIWYHETILILKSPINFYNERAAILYKILTGGL